MDGPAELDVVKGSDHLTAGDIPGLARVVAVSSFRIGVWAAATGVSASRRLVDVALHPGHAAQLAEDLQHAAAALARAPMGRDVEERLRHVGSAASHHPVIRLVAETVETVAPLPPAPPEVEPEPVNPLHEAGQRLLRASRDVWSEDRGHPAYARIIEELAPDEARILMLLLRKGPQATVDVRTGGLVGTVSSTLVAPNLTMVGALAGCRFVDRVPSYLNNLGRLGLIWFSQETLHDPMEYQVLEAQPDVLAARGSVRRAKVARRSIHLTPFGEDFCREGLGLHLSTEDQEDVPRHATPQDE